MRPRHQVAVLLSINKCLTVLKYSICFYLIFNPLVFGLSKQIISQEGLQNDQVNNFAGDPSLRVLADSAWWKSIHQWDYHPRSFMGVWRPRLRSSRAYVSSIMPKSPEEDLLSLIQFRESFEKSDFRCRFPSQYRFLNENFHLFSPIIQEMLRAGILKSPPCKAFETWARLDEIQSIEFVLASSSTASPASLFGHLMLKVNYKDEANIPGALSPFFQVVVDDQEFYAEGPIKRLWSGIVGNFGARLMFQPAYRAERINLAELRRGFRRFQILASQNTQRAVMERLWEGLHFEKAFRYYFFSHNCASLILDFLEPSFFPDHSFRRSWKWIRSPSTELIVLSHEQNLLKPLFPDIPSQEEELRNSLIEREKIRTKKKLSDDFETRDAEKRLRAYSNFELKDERDLHFLHESVPLEDFESDKRNHYSEELDPYFDGLLEVIRNQEAKYPDLASHYRVYRSAQWQDFQKSQREIFRKRRNRDGSQKIRFSLAFGPQQEPSQRAGVLIGGTLLEERLGDSHFFSTQSAGEYEFLSMDFHLVDIESPKIEAAHISLLRYMNLRRPVPVLDDAYERFFGWYFDFSLKKEPPMKGRFDLIPSIGLAMNPLNQINFNEGYLVAMMGFGLPTDLSGSGNYSRVLAEFPFSIKSGIPLFSSRSWIKCFHQADSLVGKSQFIFRLLNEIDYSHFFPDFGIWPHFKISFLGTNDSKWLWELKVFGGLEIELN